MDELEQKFAAWIERVSLSSPPPSDISVFNVGLFETPSGYTAYLGGFKEYDSDDDDWACEADYFPKEKYLELPHSFVSGKDWESVEKGMVTMIKELLLSTKKSVNILTIATILTVGFDDGTLTRLK